MDIGSTRKEIKFLYFNATSLSNKLNELVAIVELDKPDIILVSETWLDDKSNANINGYNQYRKDRAYGSGGGVCIYVSKKLNSRAVLGFEDIGGEHVWCEIVEENDNVLVGCIYRPPKFGLNEVAIKTIDELSSCFKKAKSLVERKRHQGVLIAGDFNLGSILWEGGIGITKSKKELEEKFIEGISDSHFSQVVEFPTFYMKQEPKSTLDLVFVDTQERLVEIDRGPILGNLTQGHAAVVGKYAIQANIKPVAKHNRRWYAKGDYVAMEADLSNINWSELLKSDNVDECYSLFMDKYNEMCNKHIPLIKTNSKYKNVWMNKRIMELVRRKKRLWYKLKATNKGKADSKQEYSQVCKELSKQIKVAIENYESSIANDKKNPKRLFSYVNSKKKIEQRLSSMIVNGVVTEDMEVIVEELNKQFKSVFVEEVEVNVEEAGWSSTKTLDVVKVCEEEVVDLLSALKPGKTPGEDGVQPLVLKKLAREWAKPLTLIFNKSLGSGELPQLWKVANICPLFKKGSRLEAKNYRPISLTSVVCKILEKIIKKAIMSFMFVCGHIRKEQHGFLPGRSCYTNLLETIDLLTSKMANKRWLDIIFLDFEKAFDTVPHRRLIKKLIAYGIRGKLLKWLESFLSGRKQRVVIGDKKSSWTEVSSGVPQGSVLGPLLFIIYINDLVRELKSIVKIYADDTKLIADVQEPEGAKQLQEDLNRINEWTKRWLIKLNSQKCKVMHIGKKNPSRLYSIEGTRLAESRCERDLGIIVTSNLKWNEQCQKAAGEANRVLGMLKKAFVSKESILWKKLYTTYVRPHLEYAIQAWSPYCKRDIKVLEKVQRRATKVPKEIKHLNYQERCSKLELTSLMERRIRGDQIAWFKLINGIDKVSLHSPKVEIGCRARHGDLKKELIRSSQQRANFFTNRIVPFWNKLPVHVKQSKSVTEFKASYDKTKDCYSVSSRC
jgi:hypothetical protein